MKNIFRGSIPQFEAPNQPIRKPEGVADSYHQKKVDSAESIKTRPFDAQHSATDFSQSIFSRAQQELQHRAQEQEDLDRIKNIFKLGNTKKITDFLMEDTVVHIAFHKETVRIQTAYEKELSQATFLTPADWKILTAIEIFDKETFEHSVGTYLVAKEKIEERLIELGYEITSEVVALNQFYRACLFHDIGKIAIPEFILHNKASDGDWVTNFMKLDADTQDAILVENKIVVPDAIRHDNKEMIKFFSKNRIRAVKFTPIKTMFSEKHEEKLETLKLFGINPEDSLGKIMELHEENSKKILEGLGFVIEALLAGNHHNCKYRDMTHGEKPNSLSALHISIEISLHTIHLADIKNAMSHDRPYHLKQPTLRIMSFIIDEVKNGKVPANFAARWIDDDLKKMSPGYLSEIRNKSAKHQDSDYMQERFDELSEIENFLSLHLQEKEALRIAA